MARLILLDAGVVGLLCSSPFLPNVVACGDWLEGQSQAGADFVLSDLTDFEVRRELLRLRAHAKLRRLDDLRLLLKTPQVDFRTWQKAAESWAIVRQADRPTAAPAAHDGDAILAAVASSIIQPGDSATIATTTPSHLGRFPGIDARKWEDIS